MVANPKDAEKFPAPNAYNIVDFLHPERGSRGTSHEGDGHEPKVQGIQKIPAKSAK